MTLKGNLEDFNLTNILQIISMEKKTGILKVIQHNNYINIYFSHGMIFYSEQGADKEEYKLKNILIFNNILNEYTWELVQKEHIKTLTPYWEILKKFAAPEFIKKIIIKQTKDALFTLFRWKKGGYQFEGKTLQIDKELFELYNTEFYLMEILRVVDEWRDLSNQFPHIDMKVFKGNTDNLDLEENEKYLLELVSNKTTLHDLLASSLLDEFNTRKTILNLLNKKAIKRYLLPEIKQSEKRSLSMGNSLYVIKVIAFILILLCIGIYAALITLEDYKNILDSLLDSSNSTSFFNFSL